MALARRTRNDPRREATRTALIEAAESLFAQSGVEGVSTRQIGAAIGSANSNVVAYHFGSKEELIRAVYRHRLPEIDRRRGELLAAADAAGSGQDLTALLGAFGRPLFEQVDSQGCHSYARFIAGLERSGLIVTRAEVVPEFPQTMRIEERVAACLPGELSPYLRVRWRLVAGLLSSALLLIDREVAGPEAAGRHFDNAVAMAVAAMAAPVPSSGGRAPLCGEDGR